MQGKILTNNLDLKQNIFYTFSTAGRWPIIELQTMEQQKNGRENKRRTKCMCVGVFLVWRSCRWRFSLALSLPGCSLVCQSHKCYICMCKKPLCWSAAPPLPPPFSMCGQPVCDLFKCLWKLLIYSHSPSLRPGLLFWYGIPAFSRLLFFLQETSLCGEGLEKDKQVTVVCHGFCPQCLFFYFRTLIPFG